MKAEGRMMKSSRFSFLNILTLLNAELLALKEGNSMYRLSSNRSTFTI